MKHAIRFILSLALVLPLAAAAGAEAAVEKAERDFAAAAVKADAAALEKLMASDVIYTHSSGSRDTRESYVKSVGSGALKYEKWEYSKIEVQPLSKDVAILVARADVRVLSGGKSTDMKLSLLHVFVRRQGRWQLRAHQSARLP